jgi:hypothetical protein
LTLPPTLFQRVTTRPAGQSVVHSAITFGLKLRFLPFQPLLHPCFTPSGLIYMDILLWRFFDHPDWQA